MKTALLWKSIAVAALLSATAPFAIAQNATPTCPLGNPPGYGRSLTPEQRIEHRNMVQMMVKRLREKREAGTIQADEAELLKKLETRGGPCINGTPRGGGFGRGRGFGGGMGAGGGGGGGRGCPWR